MQALLLALKNLREFDTAMMSCHDTANLVKEAAAAEEAARMVIEIMDSEDDVIEIPDSDEDELWQQTNLVPEISSDEDK